MVLFKCENNNIVFPSFSILRLFCQLPEPCQLLQLTKIWPRQLLNVASYLNSQSSHLFLCEPPPPAPGGLAGIIIICQYCSHHLML